MDSEQVKTGAEVVRTGIALWSFLAERAARQRANEKAEVEHRLEIKSALEARLGPGRADPAAELIVVDAARSDLYPDPDDAFRWGRISPWFKTEGWAFYGNGLEVGSNSAQRIKIKGSKARIVRRGGEYMVPVGRIPFASIIAADWSPDSFTGLPRIFCHFDRHRTPYEALVVETLETGQRIPGVELVDRIGLRSVSHMPGDLRLHMKMKRVQRRFDREGAQRVREGERRASPE
ncbi:MAG: hypothetical protein WD810_05190 [Solirubrobacterales bacterium]